MALTARAGVALTQATEDNVDRLMIDLKQSKKNEEEERNRAAEETTTKERDEGNKLKKKYEDMQNEVRTSKTELQTLRANKVALEVSVEKTEKDAQNSLP